MENITLAEGVKLKSIINKRIHELEEEIRRVAFTLIEKGQKPEHGPRTLASVETELNAIRKDARVLDKLIYRANIDNEIKFKEEVFAIVEAIELATQLRAQSRLYKEFAAADKEELQYGYSENTVIYKVALFDPEDYRIKALQLEKDAHKLSNLINAKNYSVQLPFNDDKYM